MCRQVAIPEFQFGSNGVRFLSTPKQIMTSLRMHAPTACIFGLPAGAVMLFGLWFLLIALAARLARLQAREEDGG